MTHHDEITTAATKHAWTIRTSSPHWIELRRGSIDLSFAFRSDGQLVKGFREDNTAPLGHRFTACILKTTKNRLGNALTWITEAPAQPVTVNLDDLPQSDAR